jgi:hypothetical protein
MNAKAANPELIVNLDRPRTACFNLKAMNVLESYYEEKTGESQLWKALDWRKLNSREATRILWASLLTDDPTLTFDQLESMVTVQHLIQNMDVLLALINDLVDRAMPVLDSSEMAESVAALQKKTIALQGLRKKKGSTGSNSLASAS